MLNEPVAKPRRNTTLIAALVAAVLVILAGGTAAYFLVLAKPGEFQITGTMTVWRGVSSKNLGGSPCEFFRAGYEDVPGSQVVVTDEAGTVIGTTTLDGGRMEQKPTTTLPVAQCVMSFQVTVPDGHDFYGVEVGSRGGMKYKREQLNAPLQLTLD